MEFIPECLRKNSAIVEQHNRGNILNNKTVRSNSIKKIVPCDDSSSVPMILMDLKLEEGKIEALLDTGASKCFITLDLIKKLKAQKKLKKVESVIAKVISVNKQVINIKKQARIHFKLGNCSWTHNFFIVNQMNSKVILGYDFIKKAKINIDWEAKRILFGFNNAVIPVDKRQVGSNLHIQPADLAHSLSLIDNGQHCDNTKWVEQLINEFPDVINTSTGLACVEPIRLNVNPPPNLNKLNSPPYQMTPDKLCAMREITNDLLTQGIIRKSTNSFASPAFLIPKKEKNQYRLVCNYKKVNQYIENDVYPLPTVDNAFMFLAQAKFFTVLDLNQAYFQLPLHKDSKKWSSFCTPYGIFEHNGVPQGIKIGSQALTRTLDQILGDYKFKFVFNFLDDCLIFSNSLKEHKFHIKQVLMKFRQYGLTVNPLKITVGKPVVKYLGHIIGDGKLISDPDRTKVIHSYKTPTKVKDIQRFLGFVGFYSRFIPKFSDIAAPLNKLRQKDVKFKWTDVEQQAFDKLKFAVTNPPILFLPDFSKEFVITADASDTGLGAILQIRENGNLYPVHYASRTLSRAERAYSTYKKEFLACLFAVEKFRLYLSKKFILQTDNMAVSYVLKKNAATGQLARWALKLAEFDFSIEHIKGTLNIADTLSRLYENDDRKIENSPKTNDFCSMLMYFPEIFQNLPNLQRQDVRLRKILDDLRNGIVTTGYSLKRNVLYYATNRNKKPKIVVPESMQLVVTKYFHELPGAAHSGIAKTINKINKEFVWPDMLNFIRNYVRTCGQCQLAKPAQNLKRGLMNSSPATYPCEKFYCDFVGPLPRTKLGHSAIFVVVDAFSKFCFIYPVRKQTAAAAIDILNKYIFAQHGLCKILVSDNGSQFTSHKFKAFLFGNSIQHITTSVYRPKSNQTERVNRNIVSALKIFHNAEHKKWDTLLPWFMQAFNVNIHESTKNTPSRIFLGRNLINSLQLNWEIPIEWSHDQENVVKKALKQLKRAHEKTSKRYNKGRFISELKIGDKILVPNFTLSNKGKGLASKLMNRWRGPFKIVDLKGVNVIVKMSPNKSQSFHVDQVKIFRE